MRVPTLATLGVIALWLATPPLSSPLLAQTAIQCKGACKQQKKQCTDTFRGLFQSAKRKCDEDKQCKKDEKQTFRERKGDCKGAFKSCKLCCGSGQTAPCSVSVCGDGVLVTGEECDHGTANSDTTPDACRTNCRSAGCGDGIVDAGEECEPPNQGPCGAHCFEVVAPPPTSSTEPPATTTTTTEAPTTTATEVPTTSTTVAPATTTSSTSSTSTTVPPVPCEGDPTRTIFAGFPTNPILGPCRQFDGDQASCEQAYAASKFASVVSCFFDAAHSTCEGCGPTNQRVGACTNTCASSTR